MAKCLIHVGYPKTGTTYLQRRIFSQLRDSFVVITPEYENCGINIRRFKYNLQNGSDNEKVRTRLRGRDVLISLEGLLFDPMRNVVGGQFAPMSWTQALVGLRRLTIDYDDVETAIIIYLRQQDELVHSLYAESKTFHFNQSRELNTLEKYVHAVIERDRTPEEPGYYYNFSNTLDEIRQIFPNCSLHVRFFENLEQNLDGEIAFWSRIVGKKLEVVVGKDNARGLAENEKIADRKNPLRYYLLRTKSRYLPALKLPNRLSRLAKRYLSSADRGDQEKVIMAAELRIRLRSKYCGVNKSLLAQAIIPEHLMSDYLDEKGSSQNSHNS